jgi:hypothetical protein
MILRFFMRVEHPTIGVGYLERLYITALVGVRRFMCKMGIAWCFYSRYIRAAAVVGGGPGECQGVPASPGSPLDSTYIHQARGKHAEYQPNLTFPIEISISYADMHVYGYRLYRRIAVE